MAADALGHKLLVVKANGENDISLGFATIVQQKVGGLVVIGDPFLISQRERLVALANFTRFQLSTHCANTL